MMPLYAIHGAGTTYSHLLTGGELCELSSVFASATVMHSKTYILFTPFYPGLLLGTEAPVRLLFSFRHLSIASLSVFVGDGRC